MTRVAPTDAEVAALVALLREVSGDAGFEAFMRRVMVHFGEEIDLNLRDVSSDLVDEFALRFHRLGMIGRVAVGGTFVEWMESDVSDEVLNAAARQAIREMFGEEVSS